MSGIPLDESSTVLFGPGVAVLTFTVAWIVSEAVFVLELALEEPTNGKRWVPDGTVVVLVTVAGRRAGGSGLSVCTHSGPPTTIRLPPWRTQFCSVVNWSLLNEAVVKLSSMRISKLFS